MTYLGYQIADEEDCSEELSAWLELHKNKSLKIWGKTTVGSGCDYGTDPEDYPWDANTFMACFQEEGDSCSFSTINEYFTITVVEPPCDRWGNTATYSSGIDLQEGYFEVMYSDQSYREFNQDIQTLLDFGSDEVVDSSEAYDFIDWVVEKYPDLVASIVERTVCNGTSNEWSYITTNHPFTSSKWQEVAQEYFE